MTASIKKLLGIDWGEKRIGLAIGDDNSRMAMPYDVVGEISDIINIIKTENVDEIVIGKPIKLSGEKIDLNIAYIDFIKNIKDNIKLPIHSIDERFTSAEADKLIGDKKTKAPRDAIAAMLILQSYLDKNHQYE